MDKAISLIPALLAILVIGGILCLPLYGWSIKKFSRSILALKVIVWVPLYLLFVLFVLSDDIVRWILASILAIGAVVEWRRADKRRKFWPYILLLASGFAAWVAARDFLVADVWLVICLSSVLSDVFAFFIGNFHGKHHLPSMLNSRKSYEGVGGQIIGGVAGIVLFGWLFSVALPLYVGLAIGAATAAGDLINSYVKRKLSIKDWANTIPGHGGIIDRFASLNMALIVVAAGCLLGGV